MGRAKDISNEKKSVILRLLRSRELTNREIARSENVSASTVDRIARNLGASTSATRGNRKNCGRRRITSQRTDRKILQTALQQRRAPIRTIQRVLREQGVELSAMTLRRRFYEANFKCRRPAKKPKLTENMKVRRLQWARFHQNFTMDYWNKVIFSDECRLEAVTEAFDFVRRRPGERYDEDCIRRTIKHPPSVMVWGCICGEGPGPIHFVDGTLRSDQYKNILTNVFLPYINSFLYTRSNFIFMQDGAPCHTSKLIKDFFLQEEIEVLPWPGNSPDLNPIENCWAYLKSVVYRRANPTVDILKKILKKFGTMTKD